MVVVIIIVYWDKLTGDLFFCCVQASPLNGTYTDIKT